MDRAVRQAVGLVPGGRLAGALQSSVPKFDIGAGLKATLDEAARGTMLKSGLKDTLSITAKSAVTSSGVKDVLEATAKGAVLGSGVRDALVFAAKSAAMGVGVKNVLGATAKGAAISSDATDVFGSAVPGVRIDGALRELFDSMDARAAALGRTTRWMEQLEVLARPLVTIQLDQIRGKNASALTATREALARTSTFAVHGEALSALARQTTMNPAADVRRLSERLRLATEAAERIAPDLVGPDASADFARSLVDDRETLANITLSDLDQRLELAMGKALGVHGPGRVTEAAQAVLLLILGVAVDRAVPDREELLRLILILVHYIRTF